MNESLKQALDQVHAEKELKDKTRAFLYEKTRGYQKAPSVPYRPILSAAACVLILLCLGLWKVYFTPVSVISIDDSDLARHSEVPITSLPHPKENLGKKAAETLLQMIAGKKKDLTYEFDTRVVERESVAEHKTL